MKNIWHKYPEMKPEYYRSCYIFNLRKNQIEHALLYDPDFIEGGGLWSNGREAIQHTDVSYWCYSKALEAQIGDVK